MRLSRKCLGHQSPYGLVAIDGAARVVLFLGVWNLLADWELLGLPEAIASTALVELAERLATGRLGKARANLVHSAGSTWVGFLVIALGVVVLCLDPLVWRTAQSTWHLAVADRPKLWSWMRTWPHAPVFQAALLAGVFGYSLRRTAAIACSFSVPPERAREVRPRLRLLCGFFFLCLAPSPAAAFSSMMVPALCMGATFHYMVRRAQRGKRRRALIAKVLQVLDRDENPSAKAAARMLRFGIRGIQDAIHELETCGRRTPELSIALAALHLVRGDAERALFVLEPYVTKPPADTEIAARIHCVRGYAMLLTSNCAHARNAFEIALSLYPHCLVARLMLARLELELAAENGCSSERLKELARAIDVVLVDARQDVPGPVGELVGAIVQFNIASKDTKALLRLRVGDLEAAESLIYAALQIDSRHSGVHFRLTELMIEQARGGDEETLVRARNDALTRLRWVLLLENNRDTWVARRAHALREALERGELPPITLQHREETL